MVHISAATRTGAIIASSTEATPAIAEQSELKN
jgi:hypothetical protein